MSIRNIKTNFYKILTGYGFYVCIIFTFILCFCTYIYNDYISGDRYSVVISLMNFDREFMLGDTTFCSFEVMRKGVGSWLSLFIPIISAFAFIPLVCDEYEAKSVRYEIFRSSRFGYDMAKYITACLCGGLAVMLGFALYALSVYLLFPNLNEYEQFQIDWYEEMLVYTYPDMAQGRYDLIILKKLRDVFLYGVASAAPAILLTSLIRNKYLVLCIPFFIKYAMDQTCVKMQSQAMEDYNNIDTKLLEISSTIKPDAIAFITEVGNDQKIKLLIYNGALVLIAAVLYMVVQSRRHDCGE